MSLSIQKVSKTYEKKVKALSGVSLNIGKGVFGLLGPNGSGKTSLMRTIATLQEPDEGQILYEDVDIFQDKNYLRERLGYLPQEFGVYPRVSAEELMSYLAALKGILRGPERSQMISDLLDLVNLSDQKHRAVSSYSGGMKRRFGVAQSLMSNPSLIIVDEPTAGLDPEERVRFLNIINEAGKDRIIVFSTHIVEDISSLCERFAIIREGQIVTLSTPRDALQFIEGRIYLKDPDLEGPSGLILNEIFLNGKKYQSIFLEGEPPKEWTPKSVTLEDFYFYQMKKDKETL